jgi:hypothetical protein
MYPFVGWRIPDSSGGMFIQLVVATALVACSDAHIDITVVGQCPDTDVDVWGSRMLVDFFSSHRNQSDRKYEYKVGACRHGRPRTPI